MLVNSHLRQHVLAAPLVAVLAELGHHAATPPIDHNAWYHSPLRAGDSDPSFHVDTTLNLWHDFGPGEGGTVIDLALRLLPRFSYPQIVAFLEPFVAAGVSTPRPAPVPAPVPVPKKSPFSDVVLAPITSPRLLTYCQQRGIPLGDLLRINAPLAQVFQQATYRTAGKPNAYTSLAWPTVAGGVILKAPPSKPGARSFMGYAGASSYTLIRGAVPGSGLLIFEAMFDCLSMLTAFTNNLGYTNADLLILNSTTNAGQTLDLIKRYPRLHLFLDNDPAGAVATAFYQAHHPAAVDERARYADFEDVNDALLGVGKKARQAAKQAAKQGAPGAVALEPPAFKPGRETSRWWLAVKWVTPQVHAGELLDWMTYYARTNDLVSLAELKAHRVKLAAQGKICVSRLCQRVQDAAPGAPDYTVLEKQLHDN